MDASFVAKSDRETWGTGWFWSGMARAACRGLEVTLLAAVDVEEGGAYPLCARQSPGAVRSRRQACGADTGRETALDAALALLEEAVDAGETSSVRWVAVDGGYAARTFAGPCERWTCTPWAGCAGTRSCASPTPVPTNGGSAGSGSSTAVSTTAPRRAWPAQL